MGRKNKSKRNAEKALKAKAEESQAQALEKVADIAIKEPDTKEEVQDTDGSSLNISSSNPDESTESLVTVDPTDSVATDAHETPPKFSFIGASPNTVLAKSQLNPLAKSFTIIGNAGCSETSNNILQSVPEVTKHEVNIELKIDVKIQGGHVQNSSENCSYQTADSDNSLVSGEESPILTKNSTVKGVQDRFPHNKSQGKFNQTRSKEQYPENFNRNQNTVPRKPNYYGPPTKSALSTDKGNLQEKNVFERNNPILSNEPTSITSNNFQEPESTSRKNDSTNRKTSTFESKGWQTSKNRKNEKSGSKNWSGSSTKESGSRDQSDSSRNRDNSSSINYTAETDDSKNFTDSSVKESWDQESDPSLDSWNNNNNTRKPSRPYNEKKLGDPRMERENTHKSFPESSDKNAKGKMTRHFDEYTNWRGPDPSFKGNEGKNTRHSFNHSLEYDKDREFDKDYDHWEKNWKKVTEFKVVNEIDGDLFQQPKDFSLAHCVAEDLRMGSGIAVEFKQQFKKVDDLMQQRPKQGGLAVLEDSKNQRFVYYLVTKRESNLKPTYYTLWKSLCKMRDHIKEHEVKKLAIPRIGCGLDRLEWDRVKAMLELLFKDVEGFQIQVCNFQQLEDTPPPKKYYPCKLVPYAEHISKIDEGTAIFYFTTEQGDRDDTLLALSKKFDTLMPSFNAKRVKSVGDFIFYEEKVKNYLFCGCVVRKTTKDLFDFKGFSKCLFEFSKINRKYGNNAFYYVAFQKLDWEEYRDNLINEKLITLFTNMLRDVEIYYCSGFLETESA